MQVSGINFAFVSMIFLLDFGTFPTVYVVFYRNKL